jgi:hypothetical protein
MTTPNINQTLRAHPRNSAAGAPMGTRERFDDPAQPMYVQRIDMVDGDYAPDGTYWGGPPSAPLWCAFSADGANCIYVRGATRAVAVAALLADFDAVLVRPGLPCVYDFYEDPGHGWAKVKRAVIDKLGIAEEVSSYSYQRGDFVYLEEDGDLGLLCTELRLRGVVPQLRRHVADRASRIRQYAAYQPTAQ